MRSKLLLHIGLPKTGSTFLQRKVFPQARDCLHFSSDNYGQFRSRMGWVYDFGSDYDKRAGWIEIESTARKVSEDFEQIRSSLDYSRLVSESSGKNLIISSEGFVGASLMPNVTTSYFARLLAPLEQDFEVTIALNLRNHIDWVNSMVRQVVVRERSWPDARIAEDIYGFGSSGKVDIRGLSWSRIIRIWMDSFPNSKILVGEFEHFKEDPVGFSESLMIKAGFEKPEVSDSNEPPRSLHPLRLLRRARVALSLRKNPPENLKIGSELEGYLGESAKEDAQELAEMSSNHRLVAV